MRCRMLCGVAAAGVTAAVSTGHCHITIQAKTLYKGGRAVQAVPGQPRQQLTLILAANPVVLTAHPTNTCAKLLNRICFYVFMIDD